MFAGLEELVVGIWRHLIVAVLLSIALPWSAEAESLFITLPASQVDGAAAKATPDLGVIRWRDVALDPAYLAERLAPSGMDNADGRLASAPLASPVRIELFPGVAVLLYRTSLSKAFGGGFIWTGESRRGGADSADLVIRGGRVTGAVSFASRTYRIDPLDVGDAHRISEIDNSSFPNDIEVPVKKTEGGTPPKIEHGQAVTEITVLIAYTVRARDGVADIVALANLAVSQANSAFSRSSVLINYRLVGTMLVNGYDEHLAASYEAVVHDLRDGTASGPFQPVHARRDAVGADLVSLFVDENDGFCGVAFRPDMPAASEARNAMSVISYDCIDSETFAHETGHNMGVRHDRYVSPAAPNSAYNYGFVSTAGRFRDLMARRDQCDDQVFSCPRINNFSNPSVLNNGFPTGVPAGTAGAADAARWLNEVRSIIAAYRATPAPNLLAAVAPVARATQVGNTVTAFAVVINAGNATGTSCSIALPPGTPNIGFTYRTRATNGALGPFNTPVNIAASSTAQGFLLTFQPTTALSTNLALVFDCTNSNPAPSVNGLSTFLLTGSTAPVADVISTAATVGNNGILDVPLGGSAAAGYAAINVGANAALQARVSAAGIGAAAATLPGSMFICQTNNQGNCLATPAATVNFNSTTNSVVTFTAFFNSNGTAIPFDPANKRLFVNFFQGNTAVGSASVAIRTVAPDPSAVASVGMD